MTQEKSVLQQHNEEGRTNESSEVNTKMSIAPAKAMMPLEDKTLVPSVSDTDTTEGSDSRGTSSDGASSSSQESPVDGPSATVLAQQGMTENVVVEEAGFSCKFDQVIALLDAMSPEELKAHNLRLWGKEEVCRKHMTEEDIIEFERVANASPDDDDDDDDGSAQESASSQHSVVRTSATAIDQQATIEREDDSEEEDADDIMKEIEELKKLPPEALKAEYLRYWGVESLDTREAPGSSWDPTYDLEQYSSEEDDVGGSKQQGAPSEQAVDTTPAASSAQQETKGKEDEEEEPWYITGDIMKGVAELRAMSPEELRASRLKYWSTETFGQGLSSWEDVMEWGREFCPSDSEDGSDNEDSSPEQQKQPQSTSESQEPGKGQQHAASVVGKDLPDTPPPDCQDR